MGQLMNKNKIRINFISRGNRCLASISFTDFEALNKDLKIRLDKAGKVYERHLKKMKGLLKTRDNLKLKNKIITARFMWRIGNEIFLVLEELNNNGFIVDDLYENLTRDLNVSKTTIKRLISLRRYFNDINELPPRLGWSKIKDAPKKYSNKS
jgi:hypothetical protein